MAAFLPDNYIQIDVKSFTDQYAICNMYTGVMCVQIVMRKTDYEYLTQKGFFIRNGKERDSADILNTTEIYHLQK